MLFVLESLLSSSLEHKCCIVYILAQGFVFVITSCGHLDGISFKDYKGGESREDLHCYHPIVLYILDLPQCTLGCHLVSGIPQYGDQLFSSCACVFQSLTESKKGTVLIRLEQTHVIRWFCVDWMLWRRRTTWYRPWARSHRRWWRTVRSYGMNWPIPQEDMASWSLVQWWNHSSCSTPSHNSIHHLKLMANRFLSASQRIHSPL